MNEPVCVVIGIGPGNGEAFARRWAAEGFRVAMLSRSTDLSGRLAEELPGARAYACDAADPESIRGVLARVREELGDPDVLVYNAGSGLFGSFEDVDLEAFEGAWRVNALGLLAAAREVTPAMKARGAGAIVVAGATASLRGGARFAAFASAKGAQRHLAQSMARHLGPAGVHVCLLVIDGMVDLPRTRAMVPDRGGEHFLKPAAIADTAFALSRQDRSAWTFEVDLRPAVESW